MAANSLINQCEAMENSSNDRSMASVDQLQRLAKQLHYTIQGEMYSAENLADLINKGFRERFQVEAKVERGPRDLILSFEKLVEFFTDPDHHKLLLIPYDADRDQRPCNGRGHKAHWGVITGIASFLPPYKLMSAISNSDKHIINHDKICVINKCGIRPHDLAEESVRIRDLLICANNSGKEKPVYQLICRQSKSKRLFLFDPENLANSNSNLKEFSPDRCLGGVPTDYLLPPGGVEAGLCRKYVIVQKQVIVDDGENEKHQGIPEEEEEEDEWEYEDDEEE